MKGKLGLLLILSGVICLLGAVALIAYNTGEETRAATASQQYLAQLINTQPTVPTTPTDHTPLQDFPLQEQTSSSQTVPCAEMQTVIVDGQEFVGYLSLPTLGLELPVLSQIDSDGLQIAPCRYTGSICTDDLVIGAHNYQCHFGTLTSLSIDDEIRFTDVTGHAISYRVAAMEVLDPYAVFDLTAGDYPLTLFTCTYGGAERIVVRCDLTS